MQISVKPILKSINAYTGKKLLSIEACYPRAIHGEVMTHRVFSRNAMSSRAVPVAKMLEQVRNSPFVPLSWGANQKGMQAYAEVDQDRANMAEQVWRTAAMDASIAAENLAELGIHKQIANRLLEPFQWMRAIITATEWDNFLELRDHPAAEPHFQILAKCVRDVLEDNADWQVLRDGEWHLPYISPDEAAKVSKLVACQISAARCARVSYLTHDGLHPSLDADIKLFEMLAGGVPMHASPLEHQAGVYVGSLGYTGNLKDFDQFRKLWEAQVAGVEVSYGD